MSTPRFVYAACAAAALCALPLRAEADAARAWAAARDQLPATATMVVGADVTAITKSTLFKQLLPLALAQQADARKGLDLLKASCKIDPFTAIHGVVVATDAERDQGAIFLSVGGGLDAAKLNKCLEELARATGAKDPKLAVKKLGAITEIEIDKDKAYVSWIGADVLAVALDIKDRAQLERWTGQKGALARSALGKALAQVNTKGAVWAASSTPKELEPGVQMKGVHGALTMTGGNIGLDLSLTLDTAKSASALATKANAQLAQMSAAPGVPAGQQALLKQVTIKAAGPQIAVKASLPEAELLGLLTTLMP